jgi:hypothetical protein
MDEIFIDLEDANKKKQKDDANKQVNEQNVSDDIKDAKNLIYCLKTVVKSSEIKISSYSDQTDISLKRIKIVKDVCN